MTAPKLDKACFPKLYKDSKKPSPGLVIGTGIDKDYPVTIVGKHPSKKVWKGNITTQVSDDTWNAIVFFDHEKDRATETVGVTVTNKNNEPSNEVPTDSEVP